MLNKTLLILGAGGHGKSVAETAELMGVWDTIVFADDSFIEKKELAKYNIVSTIGNIKNIASIVDEAIVAVGNNLLRKKWQQDLKKIGIPIATIIHPSVIRSTNINIGEGSVVMAGCILGVDVNVGEGVILNIGTMLDHDVIIGDYTHLSVGVKIAGEKTIEPYSFLDVGTTIGH